MRWHHFALGAVLLGLAMIGWAILEGGEQFREACEEIGGKPLFDGRQWQCLGAKR